MLDRGMWRYYAIAAAIVVVLGSLAFAHRLATGGWTMRPDRTATRRVNPGNANGGYRTTPPPYFTGQGDWVMSALPGCFIQESSLSGPSAAVAADVPRAALRIPPGTTLRFGDCRLLVRADDVWIWRGADRVRVPPRAALYRAPAGELTLVDRRGGTTTIRVYRTAPAAGG